MSTARCPEQLVTVEATIQHVKDEESRILEAYRLKAISVEQLRSELNGVQSRLAPLEREYETLAVKPEATAPCPFDASVEELCRIVRERVSALSSAEQQRLLRILISEIIFYGDRVVIRGVMPGGTADAEPSAASPNGGAPCLSGRMNPRHFVPREVEGAICLCDEI